MEFIYIDDVDNASYDELSTVLKENSKVYNFTQSEIKKFKKATESSKIEITEAPKTISVITKEGKEEEDDFSKEISYYITEFNSAKKDNLDEVIDDILPIRSNYNYKKIVLRLMTEVSKDIKEINEVIIDEENTMSKEELKEYKDELISSMNIMSILRKRLKEEVLCDNVVKRENKLIFVPMSSGKIRAFDEIKSIPEEYYEYFIGLLNSIKDGSFKNIRRFENSNILKGAIEVKDFKVRVVFQRLSKDCYAIISMFMKKSQNDKGYRKALEYKYTEYKSIVDKLKESIKNPEFIKLNEEYEKELFNILRRGEDDNTKGGVLHD